MRKRHRLNLSVDDRTSGMSDEALLCRSLGHDWAVRALSRRRFQELIGRGLDEITRYCEHGCGSTWRLVYDVRDGNVVENERHYPKNGEYLMPTGQGRLHRSTARVAAFARQHPEYA